MSYKAQKNSLADQVANLADVYSSVEVVPLAKAEIRRQARKGLPEKEGTVVQTVTSLVDLYVDYFGAQTVTPDPRSGSTRAGWWREGYSPYSDKTLKHAFREAWSRRAVRPQLSDEGTRTIRGRSAPESPSSYTLATTAHPTHIQCELSITPVYKDGTYPTGWVGEISQSAFQKSMGVDITDGLDGSGYPALSPTMLFEFVVSLSAFETTDSSGAVTSNSSITLKFTLNMFGVDRPHDALGADVGDVGGSVPEYKRDIFIEVPSS